MWLHGVVTVSMSWWVQLCAVDWPSAVVPTQLIPSPPIPPLPNNPLCSHPLLLCLALPCFTSASHVTHDQLGCVDAGVQLCHEPQYSGLVFFAGLASGLIKSYEKSGKTADLKKHTDAVC